MDKSFSRPTFISRMRRISLVSVTITMTLIWLLLSIVSVFTLQQYARKNLEFTGVAMSHSLEAALVTGDEAAASDLLTTFGEQGYFSGAEVLDWRHRLMAGWSKSPDDTSGTFNGVLSRWLLPSALTQPVIHNGRYIGEIRLQAFDNLIGHYILLSLLVLTGCIMFASAIAFLITRRLHNGLADALQNITDVVHDVRTHRNFSRRVSDERIAEFHLFAQDFNSLLDEMEEWQLRLQAKNAQLLRTALHDPLTGLANRSAFRNNIATLMKEMTSRASSALLFLDGDNFKSINDTWGHAAGDCVLIEVARRLMAFAEGHHLVYRIGGDEFAMILADVHSDADVQRIASRLSLQFASPIDLCNGSMATMTLSIGYALTWEHATAESLLELADKNMYQVKNRRARSS
ncbi:diguanylate cyclase DgcN [Yokenella regensburgei]|uniref:diguanylate cyclase DgcN n=1 Tax=Yokenella regensburgei TaxID=158877 RepID=UPI003F16F5C5